MMQAVMETTAESESLVVFPGEDDEVFHGCQVSLEGS